MVITLAGSENENTAGTPNTSLQPGTHPATTVRLTITDRTFRPAPMPPGDQLSHAAVGTAVARIVTPPAAAGYYEISWTFQALSYTISETRLDTGGGLSGLGLADLLRLARGIS